MGTCRNMCVYMYYVSECVPLPLRLIPIEELSCGQIGVLRKLSLVKLTALLELHKAKTNV